MRQFIRQEMEDAAKRKLNKACHALEALVPYRNMPVGYARMLLTIATNPGITVNEIARAVDEPQAKASRSLLEMGQKSRNVSGSMDLVGSEPDPLDYRLKHYYLTERGYQVVSQFLDRLGDCHE